MTVMKVEVHVLCQEVLGPKNQEGEASFACVLDQGHARPHVTMGGLEWRSVDQKANYELRMELNVDGYPEPAYDAIRNELNSRGDR